MPYIFFCGQGYRRSSNGSPGPVSGSPVYQALAVRLQANFRVARDPGLGRLFGLKSIITVSTGYRHTLGNYARHQLRQNFIGGLDLCEVERDGKLSGVGNGWFLARLHQALKKGRRCGIAFAPPDGPDVP